MASPPKNGPLAVSVFVTAPHGIGELEPLLTQLRTQLRNDDSVTILDGTRQGPPLPASALPNVGHVEHRRGVGESGFHLRCHLGSGEKRDVMVLFEDHVVPGPNFIAEVRLIFSDPSIAAIKVLGRNERSTGPWSWANFLTTFADCLHPARESPKAMLSTSAAVRSNVLEPNIFALGAWETVIMPGLNREPRRLAWSNEVWIDHFDPCGLKQALLGSFHNQRALAALRIARGWPRRKTVARPFKDLALRRPAEISRALRGRPEYRHFAAHRWRIHLVCWASMLGAVIGSWCGAGDSMRKMH
jgi:hypothetical protein